MSSAQTTAIVHSDLSIRDILKTSPLICHGRYSAAYHDIYEKAGKFFSAEHAHDEFVRMQTAGSIPTSINSVKVPTLQVTEEFRTCGKKAEYEKIDSRTKAFRMELLGQFVKAKKEEKDYYWTTYLCPSKLEERMKEEYEAVEEDVLETHEVSSKMELNPKMQTDLESCEVNGPFNATLVIGIARNHSIDRANAARRKREKKAAAEVKMSGTSVQVNEKTLEKTVASVISRQEQSRRDKKRVSKRSGNIPFARSLSLRELTLDHDRQRQEQARKVEAVKRTTFKRKIIEETASILERSSKKMKVSRVGDYPELFFTSRLESRVLYLQMKCRVSVLRTLRLTNFGVHKAHDVFLPRNIEYFLATNLKYIFPQTVKHDIPLKAYDDIAQKVKNWYHFRNHARNERLPPYLLAADRRKTEEDDETAYINAGIRVGRNMLLSEAAVVPFSRQRSEPEPYFTELGCTVKTLREFMLLNRYMAFITDKNLGIAVVTEDWYRDEVRKHLSLSVYRQVDDVPWSKMASDYFDIVNTYGDPDKRIREFLRDTPDTKRIIPNFHAIPKIHKNPWKIRPIVPMHSFYTTRLAMVVHYHLHPLVNEYPWICQSSRQFVKDLLSNTRGKKCTYRMFTGDVQSMYTNIKTTHLLKALREAMKVHGFSRSLYRWILSAVEFLNQSVYFQFSGQIFQQTYGIAMGLACSPTLANLFMGVWEANIGVEERFLFYRRYIDDIFALTDGLDCTDSVKMPGLILDWESKDNIPFLDCEVHLHGQEVCVRPYTKPLSHYQYIPWNSGHPVHVKRALVKTELLRMSSLSAKKCYFDERKKRLFIHLRARGYPGRALQAWMRRIQWRDPLSGVAVDKSTALDRPLFASSEYNPVWDHVKFGPVWDEMLREMVSRHAGPLPPFGGIVQSLQRTENLWDLVRRANRKIMLELDSFKGTPDHDEPMSWQSGNSLALR
jgi:hypothetical protein